jgi:hypothetical protein
MRSAIELHDSTVLRVNNEGNDVVIDLDAYLHRSEGEPGRDPGTGWTQLARFRLSEGHVRCDPGDIGSFEILHGSLRVGEELFGNVLPVPLAREARVEVALEGFVLDGDAEGQDVSLRADGCAIEVMLVGAPSFVEDFPGI